MQLPPPRSREPPRAHQGPSVSAALPGDLSVELATTVAQLDALQSDYRQLQSLAANVSPFSLYQWHRAWCRHFLDLDPRVKDELLVFVLRNARSECVAIVPLVASRRSFGPLQFVSIELLGADPSTTEMRSPLVVPGYEEACVRHVHRELTRICDWDWITWGGIGEAFGAALIRGGDAAGTRITTQPSAPGYLLELPSTWEGLRDGLKKNIRESLRHCYNSLKRDGHAFKFEVGRTPAEVRTGIECFLALHAKRASMTGTTWHPDHFASENSKRFLSSVCEDLAESGIVRIFQLRIRDQVVAVRIGFVVGDCLYLYYSGFDPEWARYSVMTTALAESLKYAIHERLRTANLSRGTDISKTRWGPRPVSYLDLLELRPRLISRFAYRCVVTARSGKGLQPWLLRRLVKTRRVWH